jgi:hypothetical protein
MLQKTTAAQTTTTQHLPEVPAARCTLRINQEPVYSHYTNHIREASSVPDLKRYLQTRHGWNSATAQDISWDWFATAVRKQTLRSNVHLTKLIYDKLPTRFTKYKTGGQTWLTPNCRHCNSVPETFDHLLQCEHTHGEKFRSDTLQEVENLCRKNDVPIKFKETLARVIKTWFKNEQIEELPHDTQQLKLLIHAQTSIGWNLFFRGYLSSHWRTFLTSTHSQPIPANKQQQSEIFFHTLIRTLWNNQTNFWRTYQEAMNRKPDQNTETGEIPENVNNRSQEIRHLFSLKSKVQATHRSEYFPSNLPNFLKTSTATQLQNYINNYKLPILQSIARETERRHRAPKIWTFPGFRRPNTTIAQETQDNTQPTTSTTAHTRYTQPVLPFANKPANHPRPVERAPHKHSKWKRLEIAQARFKAFFSKSAD